MDNVVHTIGSHLIVAMIVIRIILAMYKHSKTVTSKLRLIEIIDVNCPPFFSDFRLRFSYDREGDNQETFISAKYNVTFIQTSRTKEFLRDTFSSYKK